MLKLIEIVILCVYYTIPFWLKLVSAHFGLHLSITDEGSVPEMCIWSILLLKSYLKWFIHLSKTIFFIFQLSGECHCWRTRQSPMAHLTKIYGWLRSIRIVLRKSKFSMLQLIKIEFFGLLTPPLLALACFGTFWASLFNFSNFFVWLRITDEGSVPEMRVWSILLI